MGQPDEKGRGMNEREECITCHSDASRSRRWFVIGHSACVESS